jgi:hypothetical protein
MSVFARRALTAAAIAVCAALVGGGLAMPAAASAPRHDPDIIINTSGDRTSSVIGTATGGLVTGVAGVT